VVTFPVGAKKRHSGTADVSGAYAWSFKQPGIRTTAGKRTARVQVTVRNEAGEQKTARANYTIGEKLPH
jgi:hypothetical protein